MELLTIRQLQIYIFIICTHDTVWIFIVTNVCYPLMEAIQLLCGGSGKQ